MRRKVKFYWWASCKTWDVYGRDIDALMAKCHELCDRYHAIHFEILEDYMAAW